MPDVPNVPDTKQQRREQILEAAGEVFAEKGYHSASISDVIVRAGIARGTFYLYFTGKHNVLEAILDGVLNTLRARIMPIEVGPDARPPNVQLHENIRRVLSFAIDQPVLTRLVLEHGLAPDDEVAGRVTRFWDHVAEMIEASLTQGIELGMVRECDVKVVARASLGAIRGVVELLALGEGTDLDDTTAEVIAFAMRGVIQIPG
jgi:AcrR family transcriptional regulator